MVGVVAFLMFIGLTYKTRMVYYRETGFNRVFYTGFWGLCSAACLVVTVASAISPRF